MGKKGEAALADGQIARGGGRQEKEEPGTYVGGYRTLRTSILAKYVPPRNGRWYD